MRFRRSVLSCIRISICTCCVSCLIFLLFCNFWRRVRRMIFVGVLFIGLCRKFGFVDFIANLIVECHCYFCYYFVHFCYRLWHSYNSPKINYKNARKLSYTQSHQSPQNTPKTPPKITHMKLPPNFPNNLQN